jgi:regulator of protease activity HflC (stomatin/prohibitin superfamily)
MNIWAWLGPVIGVGVILLIIIICGFKIVRQSTVRVVERLGVYKATLTPGLRFVVPFFDKVGLPISFKERVADFKPQSVITKDNVTVQIDSVVYFQVTDAKLFVYGVDNPRSAIENLTATTLRNICGAMELDEALTSRDVINEKMREIIDEATDPWGIKVNRIELKNILPPRDIQDSMEKQMRAEREKRSAILIAEGEKQSQILMAEGEKQSKVLRAEAEKISQITVAEGRAEAIKMINSASPNAAYVTLMGFEALKDLANGEATKIVVPSNIADVTGLLASLQGVLGKDKEVVKKK